MKLLVFSHACVTAVNQQFYAEVVEQTGWDLTLVMPSNWKNDYGQWVQPDRWQDFQGRIVTIPVWLSGSIPLHLYRSWFVSLLHEMQPDVIYLHHEPYAAATFQVYWANKLSTRCSIGFYSAQNILKSYPLPFRQMEQTILDNSQFAFPVSHSVAQVLQHKGYQNSLTVLPLGVDLTTYYPVSDASLLATQLRTNPNQILIGYLGRITEEKGLKTLLQALQQIQSLNWKLVVVGAGAYEAEFDSMAQQLQLSDRIERVGFVPHIEAPRYLSAFDLLVLPSETRQNWKEQFGRVVIEAIACGTPVVGSDSGEIPFLLKSTGGGIIFPEAQPAQLAARLRNLIQDAALRTQLVVQGQKVVKAHYTNTAIASSFSAAIDQVLARKVSKSWVAS